MISKIYRFATLLVTLSMFLAACGPTEQVIPTNTTDPNAVLTAAAQTADARLTELAQATPSATPVPPTFTPDPALTAAAQTADAALTQIAVFTLTPAATVTPPPAPTSAQAADRAQYVADVTVPDGSDYTPGAEFTKTWRIKNAGSTTWSTSYKLVFLSGDQMGSNTSVALTGNVAPGETVDISVVLTAPSAAGRYRGYWKMQNAAGQFFDDSIYVEIDVVGEGVATATISPTPGGPTATATQPGAPTATPTQPGAPTATATQPNANPISDLSMAVDESVFSGACPHLFTFSATFTVNQAATLTYALEAGSETPGFSFNLPAAQTSSFNAGTYTLSFPLEFSSSVSGWVRLHITAPVDVTSSQVNFSLTCQP